MLMYLTIIDSKEGQQKFEFIYNRYKKLMFYIANKILGDTRDSEDTVHDAFLKIIEIIDDTKGWYLDILCYNGLPVCESCERVNRYMVIFLNILTYPL